MQATVGPDEDIAAALEDAADRARDRGGAGAEARLLERSATLTRDPALRAARLARAGWAAFSAGWSDESLALVKQGLELAHDPLTRADLYDTLGFLSWSKASYGEHCETFIAEAERVQEVDPLRAARLLWHASGELSLRFEIERHRQLVEWTWSLVAGGDEEQIAFGLTARAWQAVLDGDRSQGIDLARRGAAIVDAREELTVGGLLIDFAECLTALEQNGMAGRLLEQALPIYRDTGQLVPLIAALSVLADLELNRGRLERASAAATEALERAKELDLSRHVAWALVGSAGHRGCARACRRLPGARGRGPRYPSAGRHGGRSPRARRPRPAGARGRTCSGVDSLFRASPRARGKRRRRHPAPAMAPGPDRGLRAHQAPTGGGGRARGVRGSRTPAGRPLGTAATSRSRALLADEGSLDEGCRGAERSTDSVSPFERARTEVVSGERLRRAGRRLDSRAQLREALDEFERLGASSWAERAREELRASGETARKRDPALVDELTPRELEIALQVADGGTNKEVAARLFLSPKTVELHLSRVYRKLGIRSRTELARLMPG